MSCRGSGEPPWNKEMTLMDFQDYEFRWYFAYGSNMHTPQMLARCPGTELVGTAELTGWHFAISNRGVATVMPDQHGVVFGAVWGVTGAHLAELDRCEGVHLGLYERSTVTITWTSGPSAGTPTAAEIYIESSSEPGLPRAGYLERVLAGAAALDLPQAYLHELAKGGAR